jgi:hypothetical protein
MNVRSLSSKLRELFTTPLSNKGILIAVAVILNSIALLVIASIFAFLLYLALISDIKDEKTVMGITRDHLEKEYGPILEVDKHSSENWDARVQFGNDAGFQRWLFVKFERGVVVRTEVRTD